MMIGTVLHQKEEMRKKTTERERDGRREKRRRRERGMEGGKESEAVVWGGRLIPSVTARWLIYVSFPSVLISILCCITFLHRPLSLCLSLSLSLEESRMFSFPHQQLVGEKCWARKGIEWKFMHQLYVPSHDFSSYLVSSFPFQVFQISRPTSLRPFPFKYSRLREGDLVRSTKLWPCPLLETITRGSSSKMVVPSWIHCLFTHWVWGQKLWGRGIQIGRQRENGRERERMEERLKEKRWPSACCVNEGKKNEKKTITSRFMPCFFWSLLINKSLMMGRSLLPSSLLLLRFFFPSDSFLDFFLSPPFTCLDMFMTRYAHTYSFLLTVTHFITLVLREKTNFLLLCLLFLILLFKQGKS